MQRAGISEYEFDVIIDAITRHSDSDYHGSNQLAKILRDADKSEAFGPWGILRTVAFNLGRDFVPTEDIISSRGNISAMRNLAEKTLEGIKQDEKLRREYAKDLLKITEWIDQQMFHFPKTFYKLFGDGIAYTLSVEKRFRKLRFRNHFITSSFTFITDINPPVNRDSFSLTNFGKIFPIGVGININSFILNKSFLSILQLFSHNFIKV